MAAASRPEPEASRATCDACGASGAFAFEGITLCDDCYAERAACCADEGDGHPPKCETPASVAPPPA